jgi:hypothetical protein
MKFEPFKAKMACIETENKEVIISVIENFLCDAVGSDPEDEDSLNEVIEKVIDEYAGVICKAAVTYPQTKFVIVKPILRPRDKWYTDNYDEMKKYHGEAINKLKKTNITIVEALSRTSQKFNQDMVHLTDQAGLMFVDSILNAAEDFFKAELVDLDEEEENDNRMEVEEGNEVRQKGTVETRGNQVEESSFD